VNTSSPRDAPPGLRRIYHQQMARALPIAVLVSALVIAAPAPARADLTAFIGLAFSGTPEDTPGSNSHTSLTRGLSVGAGMLIVGFEFEWAKSGGDDLGDGSCAASSVRALCAPALTTLMGNVLLQTPRGLGPVQLYGTVGAGGYRERFDPIDDSTTGVGTNVGGGVKVSLLGPLRVRVDYRVFKLSGDAIYRTPQRIYVGANLAF
jgi:opacity protein-like surface antigen